ncbi:MAG: helix-turn-helix transcriptional regulator [Gemmatimonadetes bacterium]|nr:helix-turn-helix transcriptional regulator [Gemmatimonadota bacterium]
MVTRFRLKKELGDQMSQSELSRRSGVHVVTVNRICQNLTTRVDLATLDALSTVLGCEPGDLIERKRKRK